jgi:hypothetical protein
MNGRKSSERGQAIVLIAFAFIALAGFAALSIDGGLVYADRRHAQNAADASSLAGGGAAALVMENDHIFYKNFDCDNMSAATNAALNSAENIALSNGYPEEDITVTVTCVDTGTGLHPDRYLDVTTEIYKATQTSLIQLVYDGDVNQVVDATTRVRPRTPLVNGNAIVALNEAGCSGQSNGQGFHGTSDVHVVGGSIFSNGCLRGNGNVDVDVDDGDIYHFDGDGIDPDDFDPDPTLLDDEDDQIPTDAYTIDPLPDCDHPDAHNVSAADVEGSTLAPGLYCITGDIKVNNSNDDFTDNGAGVTLYMLDGEFVANGGSVNISAPGPDADAPAIPGMLLLFAPGNTNKIELSGNSGTLFKGTILAPESDVDLNGTGQLDAFQCQVIGLNVEVGGTADTYVFYEDSNVYSKPTWIDLQE